MTSVAAATPAATPPPGRAPAVSIGLPVLNGERFVERAIRSILDQDFTDFELVVSDNGSTDRTPEIVAGLAAADDRIRSIRHRENRGAAWNFNHVVEVTRSPLFKWAAHDDELKPTWLGRCVAALNDSPEAVLAYARRVKIDAEGDVVAVASPRPKRFLDAATGPGDRFADFLARSTSCIEAFGVIRRPALERTRLVLPYAASDRVLLAELSLLGRFVEVPETLFLHREHPDRALRRNRTPGDAATWLDPDQPARAVFPTWRLAWELSRAIDRTPLTSRERRRAYKGLGAWVVRRRWLLADNVVDAVTAARRRPPRHLEPAVERSQEGEGSTAGS
jgi:glycosyltransferase involved in cell wall biosynthesis